MELNEAIYVRRSIRKYDDTPLSWERLQKVQKLLGAVDKLYDIPMQIHLIEDGDQMHHVMPGIIGSYGKIRSPHYLVVTSETRDGYLENVGYALEFIVLELTRQGIGTCWIGGKVKRGLLSGIVNTPRGHEVVIIVSFGLPQSGVDLVRTEGGRRKALSEIIAGDVDTAWEKIIDAARVAPSAINGQPWRFIIKSPTEVDVYVTKRRLLTGHLTQLNRVDAGIALCHVKVVADHLREKVALNRRRERAEPGLKYITTITKL